MLHTWGTHPQRLADYTLASPCIHYDLPQDIFEPVILGHAAERGTRVRFDTEYLSHEQDSDGVTVRVRDRLGGSEYSIRCKYLIGADGGRSKIAADLGLPMEGEMDWAGSMNIVFHADLSKYVAHRPSVLYWIMQPGADIGGIGMGLVRMVRPWDEWLIVWGYDIADPPPFVDEEVATRVVHNLVGDDTIPVTLRSTSLWGNNKMYAERYVEGRVFCMGDACHRHPPSNGLGSNTSIGDAYNLAWKLALVLDGKAAPSLLDSYDAERAPIGRQIVLRANKSIEEFGPIFDALGLLDTNDPEQMRANMEVRKENSPRGAEARAKLAPRSSSRTTSSTRTASSSGSAIARTQWCRTGRRSRPTPATRSSTTTPRRGRAHGCRTCGSSTAGRRSPRTTSPARGASRCSPASAARHGSKRRRP